MKLAKRGGGIRYDGAAAAAQIDDTFVSQVLVGVKRGVQVEIQRVRDLARGGEPVTRSQATSRDRAPDGRGDLFPEGNVSRGVDANQHSFILVTIE